MESASSASSLLSPVAVSLSTKRSPPPPTTPLDTGQQAGSLREATTPGSNSDDVETFTGKIVYNPDGSAYIIEGGSDGSDVESEVGTMLPLNQEGSIVDRAGPAQGSSGTSSSSQPATGTGSGAGTGTGSSSTAIPQVVSAFHIQRASSTSALQGIYSALYGGGGQGSAAINAANASQLLNENLKVPEVPIMHSYRVFTLRDKDTVSSATRSQPSDIGVGPNEGDATNNLDQQLANLTKDDESQSQHLSGGSPTVPVKPILMCFICKISFGFAKSFVTHATGDHHLDLIEAERRLLSQKNTSAIIQGVGKDKEPMLSFLEPKNKAPQPLLPSSLAGLAANLNQLSAAAAVASPSSTSSLHQQFQQQLEAAQQRLMAAAMASMQPRHGTSSVSSSSATSTSGQTSGAQGGGGGGDTGHQRESPSRPSSSNGSLNLVLPKNGASGVGEDEEGRGDDSLTPELAELASLEKMAKAAAAAIQQQEVVDNQMTSPNMQTSSSSSSSLPLTTQYTPKPIMNSSAFCGQHPDGEFR